MHDLLFAPRRPPSDRQLESYATRLELDLQRFRVDQHSPAIARRVRDDEIGGLRSGVIGTPTFFVNDRHFHDRPDLETLSAAIGISLLSSCSKTPNASTTSR